MKIITYPNDDFALIHNFITGHQAHVTLLTYGFQNSLNQSNSTRRHPDFPTPSIVECSPKIIPRKEGLSLTKMKHLLPTNVTSQGQKR